MTDGLRYNHVSASLDPRGGQSEIDWDLKDQSKGYDMATLPYCRYAGIVWPEERNVSNSLLNLQDM